MKPSGGTLVVSIESSCTSENCPPGTYTISDEWLQFVTPLFGGTLNVVVRNGSIILAGGHNSSVYSYSCRTPELDYITPEVTTVGEQPTLIIKGKFFGKVAALAQATCKVSETKTYGLCDKATRTRVGYKRVEQWPVNTLCEEQLIYEPESCDPEELADASGPGRRLGASSALDALAAPDPSSNAPITPRFKGFVTDRQPGGCAR